MREENLENLLAHTASVTTTLASRGQVIGRPHRQPQPGARPCRRPRPAAEPADHHVPGPSSAGRRTTSRTILRSPRPDLGAAWCRPRTSSPGIRRPFVDDVKQLRVATASPTPARPSPDRALQVLPIKAQQGCRTATYGSWFNFLPVPLPRRRQLPGPKNPLKVDYPPAGTTVAPRCDSGMRHAPRTSPPPPAPRTT